MCKYLKVIFAKFSLVCIFLTVYEHWMDFLLLMFSSCCLSAVETLIEWLHDTLYI